jgi:O-antigen/teichoic acid export membrane protein
VSQQWLPSEHGTDRGGLQKRVVRGLTWTLIDNWGSQVLSIVILFILLRLLKAEDVGLVALAAAFVALAQLFVDQGFGDALIQKPALTRMQIDTAFWTAVATGTLLMVVGIVAAAPVAALVREPRLTPLLQVLSLSFLLTAFDSIQTGLLRREMAFGALAARRLIAVSGGGAIGIALAYLGFGPWALVGQQLGTAAIAVIALWTVSPWRPGLSASWADFRTLFSFGINVVGSDLLFYLSRNVDSLLVGTFLGPVALGLYAVGSRFLDASTGMLIQASRKLVFPTFARLQHDRDRLRRAYGRMNRAMAAVTLPGYIGLALVAQDAIVVFAGERWTLSGPVATVLVLVGPVLTLQGFSGGLLNAVGHPEVTLRFRFISAVVNVAGFLVAVLVFHEIVAVAVAYVVRGYLLVPLILWWMQVYAGIPVSDSILRLRRIAAATAVMAAAVLLVKFALIDRTGTAKALLIEVAVGIVVYVGALWVLERSLLRDLWQIGLQAVPGAGKAHALGVRLRMARRSAAPLSIPADDNDLD